MRTEQEIASDVNAAAQRSDHKRLDVLADEAAELGTDHALSVAFNARGIAASKRSEYDVAQGHFFRALDHALQAGKDGLAASIRNNIGSVHQSLGEYDRAEEQFRMSLDTATTLGDSISMSLAIGNLGILSASRGEYANALSFMSRGLEIEERSGNEVGSATTLGNMGIVYYRMGDLASSLQYYQRALELHERLGNKWGIALNTGNIGTAYVGIGDHVQAAEYFRRAIPLHQDLGNVSSVARVNGNLGVALREGGDLEGSRKFLTISYRMHAELGNLNEMFHSASQLISTLLELNDVEAAHTVLAEVGGRRPTDPRARSLFTAANAYVNRAEGKADKAIEYLQEALVLAQEINAADLVMFYHHDLRELALQRRDIDAYVHYNTIYLEEKDRINGRDVTSRIATLSAERTIALERAEREKERAVLDSALPKHIVERVLRGDDVSGDLIEESAILFLDIVGFTSKSATMPPKTLTTLLSQIFTTFDGICAENDVTKIKTIGDAYMAVAFPQESPSREQRVASCKDRAARVACAMLASSFTWPDGDRVQFRIGLHSGPVVAGVLGTDRLQYDVWGDTVNTASRLEGTSEPGRIHVSEAFATSLVSEASGTWHLAPRGEIELKGKGPMTTYWLHSS